MVFKVLIIALILFASKSMGSLNDTNVYYRPFDLMYADQGGKTIPEDDTTIINALQNFPEKPTLLTCVFLNIDPTPFDAFISNLKEITPNLFFALGKQEDTLPQDSLKLITLATEYSKYTTCIRIDHFNSLVQNSSGSAVRNYLKALHNIGFQNIMSNPWKNPDSGNGWPYVNAAEIAIDTSSWQAQTDRIKSILAQDSNVTVVVNYENPPGELALDSLGAQGSIDAMSIAADAQDTSQIPYRWMPPWSHNYDPYQLNTLGWIANKLVEIDPVVGLENIPLQQVYKLLVYPNPFTGRTCIYYSVGKKWGNYPVRLTIQDFSGRVVKIILNKAKPSDSYECKVNLEKDCEPGIYFAVLKVGKYQETKKMVFIR